MQRNNDQTDDLINAPISIKNIIVTADRRKQPPVNPTGEFGRHNKFGLKKKL